MISTHRFSTFVAVSALTLAASAALAPVQARTALSGSAALRGPPAICFRIDIGSASSIPWGFGSMFEAAWYYDTTEIVDDTLELLDGSDDVLVHMETLRRAVVLLAGLDGNKAERGVDWSNTEADRLLAALRSRTTAALAVSAGAKADADAKRAAEHIRGLAHFDLGYALAAAHQSGLRRGATQMACFDMAIKLRPDDGAISFGAAVASFSGNKPTPVLYDHLARAMEQGRKHGPLRKNMVKILGGVLGADSYSALASLVAKQTTS
jgi:hypothetical protein